MTRTEALRWIMGTLLIIIIWQLHPLSANFLALFSIALLGLPHGAADALLIKKKWPSLAMWAAVTVAYALLAIIGAILFLRFPAVGLFIFIIISMWHFGTQEDRNYSAWSVAPIGGIFILGPFVYWGVQIDSYLLQLGLQASERSILLSMAPIIFFLSVMFLLMAALIQYRYDKTPLIGLLLSAPVAILLPPLLSFSLYFCLIHAPRHSAVLNREMPNWWRHPAVVLALILTWITAGFWIVTSEKSELSARTAIVLIIGLAALTVPHMLLTAWVSHSNSSREIKTTGSAVD